MKRTHKILFLSIFNALLLILASVSGVMAQEDGFTDGFDGTELQGWEHSPEAVVSDGVLRIGPGNFAVRGNFTNFKATFQVKLTQESVIAFRFNMQEEQDYACIFFPDSIVLERTKSGEPQEIGGLDGFSGFSGEWDTVEITSNSGSISITMNDTLLIEAQDTGNPIGGGAIGLMVFGENSADFDNVSVTVLEGTGGPVGEEPPPMEAESAPVEPTAEPTSESGIEGFLKQLTESRGGPLDINTTAINLLLSVVMAYILSRVYVHWGSALSNRRRFAANFILITVTTTFIILIVRSSVALSLGLVGALSIVRFRAAIKEPEELAYLFFAIGIGIGLGDNQRLITVMALAAVVIVIAIMRLFRGRHADFNMHLTVASGSTEKVTLENVTDSLKKHASQSRLMRFDENKDALEASYLVEFKNNAQFEGAKNALKALSKDIEITFLDNKGIG